MPVEIHPTAIIGERAELGIDVSVGPYSIIENDTIIGDGTRIGSHCTVHPYVRMGVENQISSHADIGGDPQDFKFKGEATWLEIGDRNLIREFSSIHRSNDPDEPTTVGNENFIMGYAHIAHNCRIGNNVILVNYAGLSGHVEVEDRVIVSGGALIHQFVKIGYLAMISG